MLDTSMNTSCQCQPNASLRRTMHCYNIVAIGAPTFPTHTWLLLQDIKCPGIQHLTKINVESWRRYQTVEDEQNDESLG
ncbi:hypothetical protein CRE_13083 [Caenorhabditis remanei]|uniref:Uncharacterized protein n=1 Tax=Caenorhabditis remanei TaxID=31234 RepID=E3NBP6_CAERE|nr:hypothetical protein CRE_13083 [Caenorhabditis remanei]